MKTPYIIGLTVVATVATFTAGGVVATKFMQSALQSATLPQTATAPAAAGATSAETVTRSSLEVAAIAPPAVEPAPAIVVDVAAAAPEPEVVTAKPANTADVLRSVIAKQSAVEAAPQGKLVLFNMVSEGESKTQFENAIPAQVTKSILAAAEKGKTEDDLVMLVSSAIQLGMIDPPQALRTSEGEPDARAILLSILRAQEEQTGVVVKVAGAADVRPIERPIRNQIYTVAAGDSLAYIALQFYGDTESYRVIFNANRSKIESPDRIQVGQRLIIPAI